MAGWLLLVIEDDLPTILHVYATWEAARDSGNEFLQENDIPGKFVGDEAPDREEALVCDSARFTGTVGIYDLEMPDDSDDEDDDEDA